MVRNVSEFTERTVEALGSDLLKKLENLQFCVIGCSGTGANFAEMLVRTGAVKVDLIDGSYVKRSGLNRVLSFLETDCEKMKVDVLKKRLETIRQKVSIRVFKTHFRTEEQSKTSLSEDKKVLDAVVNADVVFIAVDNRESRLAIEELCRGKEDGDYLSCGIHIDREKGDFSFECLWHPKSPPLKKGHIDGYGPKAASFGSIVIEAASVAFTMLLSHLHDPESDFRNYTRQYDGSFRPINQKSSCKPLQFFRMV